MRSFNESLQAKKNLDILEKFLSSMYKNSLKPSRFVEWVVREGHLLEGRDFSEGAREWLHVELALLHESLGGQVGLGLGRAGQWVQNQGRDFRRGIQQGSQQNAQPRQDAVPQSRPQEVRDALQSLQDLSKRSPRIAQKLGDPNFGAMVMGLIAALQDDSGPMGPTAAKFKDSWYESHVDDFSLYVADQLADRKIHRVVNELVRRNINADLFVDWYVNEGCMVTGRQFDEDWRDWLGNFGAGVRGAFRSAKKAWGDLRQGWKGGQDRYQDQQTQASARTAADRLQKLKNHGVSSPQLTKQLDAVLNGIQTYLGAVPEAPEGDFATRSHDVRGNYTGGTSFSTTDEVPEEPQETPDLDFSTQSLDTGSPYGGDSTFSAHTMPPPDAEEPQGRAQSMIKTWQGHRKGSRKGTGNATWKMIAPLLSSGELTEEQLIREIEGLIARGLGHNQVATAIREKYRQHDHFRNTPSAQGTFGWFN
jgi:hypothetical protein